MSDNAKDTKTATEGPSAPLSKEDAKREVVRQVEFYFSDANFPFDRFLFTLSRKDPQGWIPLATIATFKRMKPMSALLSVKEMCEVLAQHEGKGDDVVEVDVKAEKVKRKRELKPVKDAYERSVYVKGFGEETPTLQPDLEKFFARYGQINVVRMRRDQKTRLFKGSVFVEFASHDEMQRFLGFGKTRQQVASEQQQQQQQQGKQQGGGGSEAATSATGKASEEQGAPSTEAASAPKEATEGAEAAKAAAASGGGGVSATTSEGVKQPEVLDAEGKPLPVPTWNGEPLLIMSKDDYCVMKMEEKGIDPSTVQRNGGGGGGRSAPAIKTRFNAFRELDREARGLPNALTGDGGTGAKSAEDKAAAQAKAEEERQRRRAEPLHFEFGGKPLVTRADGSVDPATVSFPERSVVRFRNVGKEGNWRDLKDALNALHATSFVELPLGATEGAVGFKTTLTDEKLQEIRDAKIRVGGAEGSAAASSSGDKSEGAAAAGADSDVVQFERVDEEKARQFYVKRANFRAKLALDQREERQLGNSHGGGGGGGGGGRGGRGGGRGGGAGGGRGGRGGGHGGGGGKRKREAGGGGGGGGGDKASSAAGAAAAAPDAPPTVGKKAKTDAA